MMVTSFCNKQAIMPTKTVCFYANNYMKKERRNRRSFKTIITTIYTTTGTFAATIGG